MRLNFQPHKYFDGHGNGLRLIRMSKDSDVTLAMDLAGRVATTFINGLRK